MSRSVWGPCTWYLFHTLAEKIKDEHFDDMKMEIISVIGEICQNLPCPECMMHAAAKMKKLNSNSIQTKEHLQIALLQFHNEVNTRKGKPLFTQTELNNKYRLAKTDMMINYFIQTWTKQYNIPKLMSQGFHRRLFLNKFRTWINTHRQKFMH